MITTCPCHSGKAYVECCRPYHEGGSPQTAELLMRSRYSAYALGLSDYIILTTHPENPTYLPSLDQWKKEIQEFSKNTTFEGLTIVGVVDGEDVAFVTFVATLKRGNKDVSFQEKSRFEKVNGRWLYKDGEVVKKSSSRPS